MRGALAVCFVILRNILTRNATPILILFVSLPLFLSCNRSTPATPSSSSAAAPSGGTTQAAPVAAPAVPVPSYSAAEKIGAFVYPKNGQNHDQQLIDEFDCYNQVEQQTGINPEAGAPTGPSDAEVQAAQHQAADQAGHARGGRVRGAARGAAGGAMIGAIAGDAGKGAAIGAVGGTMIGGARQRRANAAAKQQASQSASAQMQQQAQQEQAAYDQQQATFMRGFSACLDARGYSVK
jgi:hypothetical protein